MSLGDWIDRYIISIGPRKDEPPTDAIDLPGTSLQTGSKLATVSSAVDESSLRAIAGLDIAFQKIYEAAKIPVPEHKFTVEKVGEMLAHPKLSSLTSEAKAAAVLVALDSQGVKIESVIEEAVKKDKALDVFEKVQRDHLKQAVQAKAEENLRLAEEIEKITREKQKLIEDNKRSMVELQARVDAWVEKKRATENDIHEIVQHFTAKNPITVEPPPLPPAEVKVTDLTQTRKPS